jgi:hypothetical protein
MSYNNDTSSIITVDDQQDTCEEFYDWYTRHRDDLERQKVTFKVNPYTWNRVAPRYLVNKKMGSVTLCSTRHQNITLPVWQPDCDDFHCEFVEPSDSLQVTSTDRTLKFLLSDRGNSHVLPEMQRHDSVDLIQYQGETPDTTIHLTRQPPVSTSISIRNVHMSSESFEHVLGYKKIELLDIFLELETRTFVCPAEEVHISASILGHIVALPNCKVLKIHLDVIHLDHIEMPSIESIQVYGVVGGPNEYIRAYTEIAHAFPKTARLTCDITFDTTRH